MEVIGGAAISRNMPLGRRIRDARAGIVTPPNLDACLEALGRLALGLEPAGGLFGSA
jgi:alkylation response protein AidB-like acyl-CoA dehydrogenase